MSKLKKYKAKDEYFDRYFKCYDRCNQNLKRLKTKDDCIFLGGTKLRNKKDCEDYCKQYVKKRLNNF